MTMPAATDRLITGLPLIAKCLRRSRATAHRYIKQGRLKAFKMGDNTSPLCAWMSDIDRVRRGDGAK